MEFNSGFKGLSDSVNAESVTGSVSLGKAETVLSVSISVSSETVLV